MRFYILEDLVDPVTKQSLRLENAVVAMRPGPSVELSRHWCDVAGATPEGPASGCSACRDGWVTTGMLVAGDSRYPIVDGIPRMLRQDSSLDQDTQESFGFEWQHFDTFLSDYDEESANYFGIVPREVTRNAVVLDAGCGMGRWTKYVASLQVRRIYAMDFSRAIDHAANTLRDVGNAHCVQADICHLPFRDQTFDFTYCLGVLHHLKDPDQGMGSVNRVTRLQGALLIYLYYALDNRPAFHRWLLAGVTGVRRLTSRLPKPVMFSIAWAIGIGLYWPLARAARVIEMAGMERAALQMPLAHYRSYSLRFMAGDAFDRFATPIEKRYSRSDIAAWLAKYGRDVSFSDHTPYWVTLARTRG